MQVRIRLSARCYRAAGYCVQGHVAIVCNDGTGGGASSLLPSLLQVAHSLLPHCCSKRVCRRCLTLVS